MTQRIGQKQQYQESKRASRFADQRPPVADINAQQRLRDQFRRVPSPIEAGIQALSQNNCERAFAAFEVAVLKEAPVMENAGIYILLAEKSLSEESLAFLSTRKANVEDILIFRKVLEAFIELQNDFLNGQWNPDTAQNQKLNALTGAINFFLGVFALAEEKRDVACEFFRQSGSFKEGLGPRIVAAVNEGRSVLDLLGDQKPLYLEISRKLKEAPPKEAVPAPIPVPIISPPLQSKEISPTPCNADETLNQIHYDLKEKENLKAGRLLQTISCELLSGEQQQRYFVLSARYYYLQNNYRQALDLLEQITLTSNYYTQGLELRFMVYQKQKDYDAGLDLVTKLVNSGAHPLFDYKLLQLKSWFIWKKGLEKTAQEKVSDLEEAQRLMQQSLTMAKRIADSTQTAESIREIAKNAVDYMGNNYLPKIESDLRLARNNLRQDRPSASSTALQTQEVISLKEENLALKAALENAQTKQADTEEALRREQQKYRDALAVLEQRKITGTKAENSELKTRIAQLEQQLAEKQLAEQALSQIKQEIETNLAKTIAKLIQIKENLEQQLLAKAQLKTELQKLKQEIEKIQQANHELNQKLTLLQQQQQTEEIKQLTARLTQLQTIKTQTEEKLNLTIAELQQKIAALESEKAQRKQAVASAIATLQGTNPLNVPAPANLAPQTSQDQQLQNPEISKLLEEANSLPRPRRLIKEEDINIRRELVIRYIKLLGYNISFNLLPNPLQTWAYNKKIFPNGTKDIESATGLERRPLGRYSIPRAEKLRRVFAFLKEHPNATMKDLQRHGAIYSYIFQKQPDGTRIFKGLKDAKRQAQEAGIIQ